MNNLEKVEMMIAQADDIQRILDDGVYAKTAYLNFRQRRRFMATAFAKNGEDAMNRLYEVEKA